MSFRAARLGKEMLREAAEYISSIGVDAEIYAETLVINAVHLKMLARLGIISRETLERGLAFLKEAYGRSLEAEDPRLEDVHMMIEENLTRAVPEAGENLALGKSRNDTVATAIRMRVKRRLLELVDSALIFAEKLLEKAGERAETIYPATTHLQVAAPATFGFILASYTSRILASLEHLAATYEAVDLCPQGSGACCGTTIPLDRAWLASQLGFRRVLEHALDASSSRDFVVDVIGEALKVLVIASDLSEQLILDLTSGLVMVGDEFCSTSSIMPQKRNPVVLEVARTKASDALAELVRVASIIKRRSGGYVLDLQEVTPSLWRVLREASRTMRILSTLISTLEVREEEAMRRCGLEAGLTELANYLALKLGVGFRRAHRVCGRVARIMAEGSLTEEAVRSALEAEGVSAELRLGDVEKILDPRSITSSYATLGSARPSEVRRMVAEMRHRIAGIRVWVSEKRQLLEEVVARAFDPDAT